jgi:hypothetical protein
LSAAILFTKNKDGFIGEITNPYAGGKAARFLFPASVAVPFIVGLLIVIAVLNGLISVVAGIAVLVTSISLVFGLLISITARIMNASESARLSERETSTKKLQQFNLELEGKVQEQTRHIFACSWKICVKVCRSSTLTGPIFSLINRQCANITLQTKKHWLV